MTTLTLKARTVWMGLSARVRGKVLFRDKFGLRYYLWPDTRLEQTVMTGCRTDDEGLLLLARGILDLYNAARVPASRIVAFDVGAFIGIISLGIASKMRPGDVLYSFEPSPKNRERLLANLRLNTYEYVRPVPNGVGDKDGERCVVMVNANPGANALSAVSAGSAARGDEVVSVTLDSFCQREGVQAIDILKVDTEGRDGKVLRGAEGLFRRRAVQYLFMECEDRESDDFRSSRRFLEENGYRIHYIVRNSPRLAADMNVYPSGVKPPLNMLAVSSQAPFPVEQITQSIPGAR